MYYKCKRDIWSPSPFEDYPDVLSFKKGNLYILEKGKFVDEEESDYIIEDVKNEWFSKHFEQI